MCNLKLKTQFGADRMSGRGTAVSLECYGTLLRAVGAGHGTTGSVQTANNGRYLLSI